MSKLKLICFLSLIYTASFAQQADSTKNQANVTKQDTEAVSVKGDQKYLSKQVFVSKKATTWTKIKDLFM